MLPVLVEVWSLWVYPSTAIDLLYASRPTGRDPCAHRAFLGAIVSGFAMVYECVARHHGIGCCARSGTRACCQQHLLLLKIEKIPECFVMEMSIQMSYHILEVLAYSFSRCCS
jgi:hypothetical protein